MIIRGKEIGIKKRPFDILKKNVCDDSKDLEDMIKRDMDFEVSLNAFMNEKSQEIVNNSQINNSKSLFSPATVRAVQALKRDNEEKQVEYDER